MEQAVYDNFLLLQTTPIEQLYALKLTPDLFLRGSPLQRMLALHYLMSILDPKRCASAFQGALAAGCSKPTQNKGRQPLAGLDKGQNRQIQIVNQVQFRRVLYELVAEVSQLAGFEMPSSAEFCTGNPRNLKMLYCISKFLVRLRAQQLIQELGEMAPFKTQRKWQSEDDATGIEQLLCSEVQKSADEWKRIKEISKFVNEIACQEEGRVVQKVERVLPSTATQQGIAKVENYINRVSKSVDVRSTQTPNFQELQYMQPQGSKGISVQAILEGLLTNANKSVDDLGDFLQQKYSYVDGGSVAKLLKLKRRVQEEIERLQKRFETTRIRFVEADQKEKVMALQLQHYSQMAEVDILSDIDLSAISQSQVNQSQISVLEHSIVDESRQIRRSVGSVLQTQDLTSEKQTSHGNRLSERLKHARPLDSCDVISLVGGQVEGVREYLRIQ